jgi:hypothetical protein
VTMLSAAVKMGAPKIVAALLGAKVNPNATNGFEKARKLFFLMIKTHQEEEGKDKGRRRGKGTERGMGVSRHQNLG